MHRGVIRGNILTGRRVRTVKAKHSKPGNGRDRNNKTPDTNARHESMTMAADLTSSFSQSIMHMHPFLTTHACSTCDTPIHSIRVYACIPLHIPCRMHTMDCVREHETDRRMQGEHDFSSGNQRTSDPIVKS